MNKWKKVKLGDIATYINGCAFKPSDWSNQGVPIVRIQNLTGSFSETNYYDKHYNSKYEINNGDVLISWSASLGVYVWDKGRAILNQHIFKVVFNKIDIDKTYFIFAVKSLLEKMEKQTHGATMKHITKPLFDNMEFPLPPMEEQKKIAARLDAVSDLLAKQKQLLSEQDTLIQSTFYDMFGNPIKNEKGWKFSKISSIYKVRSSQRIHQKDLALSGIPFLRVSDLEKKINCVSPNINLFISDEFFSILHKNRDIPEENDILITTRGTLGDVYIYKNNDRFYFQDGMITWLKPNKNSIMPLFFLHLFKTCEFKNSLHKYKGGTTVAYLSIKNLSDLLIPVPPLELQQKFAAIAEQIEAEKSKIKSAIAETQTLFNSMMSEYFEE